MLLSKLRRKLGSPARSRNLRPSPSSNHRRFRPRIEQLEDRMVLNYSLSSTTFQWVELNGDPSASALITYGDNWANPIDLGSNTINFYVNTFHRPTRVSASNNRL